MSILGIIILIVLMYAGRVGILTFVVAVASRVEAEPPDDADLVL